MIDLREYFKYLPAQENVQCCTSSATLLACEYLYSKHNDFKHFSRLFLYYMTRKYQNRVGQKGASLGDTLKTLSKTGCCLDIDWPFVASRDNREPHQLAIKKAEEYKLQSYEELSDINFKNYLNQNIPVIVGMHVGRKFLTLSGPLSTQEYTPINEMNRYSRGHAITVVGYDDNLRGGSWIIANSMGLKWGDRGFGAIPYECNVDIGEAFVIKQFAGRTADKKISDN